MDGVADGGPIGNKTTKKKLKIVMRPNGKQKTRKKKGSNNWRNNNSRATHGEMFVSHHLPLCWAYPPSPRSKCAAASGPCKQINSAAKCKQSKSQMLRWELKQAYAPIHMQTEKVRERERGRGSDTQLSTPTQLHIRIVGYNTQPSQRSPIIINLPCQSWPSFEISPSFRLIHISGLFVLACYTSHTQFISTNFVECFSRVCHASFEWEWQNLRIC